MSRITTRVRTWLFVAGLTALLIVAGAPAGGPFLYAFVVLAVLMNLGGYWFSDRIALAASRARPLDGSEAPGLHAAVAELAHILRRLCSYDEALAPQAA